MPDITEFLVGLLVLDFCITNILQTLRTVMRLFLYVYVCYRLPKVLTSITCIIFALMKV